MPSLQMMTGLLLYCCATWVEELYNHAQVGTLTFLFFVFVLLAATQVGMSGEH